MFFAEKLRYIPEAVAPRIVTQFKLEKESNYFKMNQCFKNFSKFLVSAIYISLTNSQNVKIIHILQ